MTPANFAALVKKKYPHYTAVEDKELVARVLARHPSYAKAVDQTEPISSKLQQDAALADAAGNAGDSKNKKALAQQINPPLSASPTFNQDVPPPKEGDIVRSTSPIPLNAQGIAEMDRIGRILSANGGLDKMVVDSTERTKQAASIISRHLPGIQTSVTDQLNPHRLGALEGMRHSAAQPQINTLFAQPAMPAPGGGESANDYIGRVNGAFGTLIKQLQASPKARIGVVAHSTTFRPVEAQVHAPAGAMLTPEDVQKTATGPPGSVSVLKISPAGKTTVEPYNEGKPNEPGLYLIRHGQTDMNAATANPAIEQPPPAQGFLSFRREALAAAPGVDPRVIRPAWMLSSGNNPKDALRGLPAELANQAIQLAANLKGRKNGQ